MFCTLSFTRAHSHMHWHMQSNPHTAMHYWRLGVIMFPPAKATYTSVTTPAIGKSLLPLSQCEFCQAGINYRCYLDPDETKASALSEAQAGPIPPSLLASVKEKGQRSFVRSKEAVSESSSWSACIPSISCTASWTRIRRQIPTVISQQQRGCYIVWSCWCRGLCAGYVVCEYKVVPPGAFSGQVFFFFFALCSLAEILDRLLIFFMSL